MGARKLLCLDCLHYDPVGAMCPGVVGYPDSAQCPEGWDFTAGPLAALVPGQDPPYETRLRDEVAMRLFVGVGSYEDFSARAAFAAADAFMAERARRTP